MHGVQRSKPDFALGRPLFGDKFVSDTDTPPPTLLALSCDRCASYSDLWQSSEANICMRVGGLRKLAFFYCTFVC